MHRSTKAAWSSVDGSSLPHEDVSPNAVGLSKDRQCNVSEFRCQRVEYFSTIFCVVAKLTLPIWYLQTKLLIDLSLESLAIGIEKFELEQVAERSHFAPKTARARLLLVHFH